MRGKSKKLGLPQQKLDKQVRRCGGLSEVDAMDEELAALFEY